MMPKPKRTQIFTEKGRTYNAERRKESCKEIITRIERLRKDIETNSRLFDNVHIVENDLQDVERLVTDFQKEYEQWLALLNDEDDVHQAHQWYKENRRHLDVFIAGIKDWTVVAKEHIERQLEKTPSQLSSTRSSRRSIALSERVRLAELEAQSQMLAKKQALRNEMERLQIEEQIAIAQAREQVFQAEEEENISQRRSEPCLPRHRKYSEARFDSNTFPGFWSRDYVDDVLPSFLRQRPDTSYDATDGNEGILPATPLKVRPTPPTVKASPIPSSLASRGGTYSLHRPAGPDVMRETSSLSARRQEQASDVVKPHPGT